MKTKEKTGLNKARQKKKTALNKALEASVAGQGPSPEHLSLITSIQVQSLIDPEHSRQMTADEEHLRPNAASDLVVVTKPNQGKAQLQDRLDCPVSELVGEPQLRQKQQLDMWPSMAQLEKTVAFNLNNSKPPSDASDVSHTTMDGAWLPVEKPGRKAIYQHALPSDQPKDLIKDKVPASPRLEPEVTGTPEASEFHPSFSKQMETDLLDDGKTSDAPILRKIVTRRTKPKTAPIIFDTPIPSEVGLGLFAEPPSSTGLGLFAEPPSSTGLSPRAPTTKRLVKRRALSSKPVSRLSESSEDSLLGSTSQSL